MSDVILVYPRTGLDVKEMTVTLPLAILGAASGLIPEFSVKVIDQRTDDDWKATLKRHLTFETLCVGISSMTGTQIYYALEVSQYVREITGGLVPIVWGGMHATLMPEQTVNHPLVDYVLIGEGEVLMRDFVRALADKKSLREMKGIGGKGWNNGRCDDPDINNLPAIPYGLVNIENYTQPTEYLFPGIRRLLPYQGSRGCPYKCTFCSEPVLTKFFRMIKPEKFVKECLSMKDTYNLDHIPFYDEEFFVNIRWSTEIAKLINGQFTWTAQARADDLLKIDLPLMERSGLRVVWPGLESGSDRILKWIKKRETVEMYLEANRRLANTGIIPKYNFIIGFPGETKEELDQTVDLTLRLMKDNPLAVVNSFSPLTPLPGTELLDISVKEFGFKAPQTLEEWIGISRRQLPTPWQQAQKEMFQNLMYTSVFANTAKRFAQDKWWAPQFMFNLYSELIKYRWEKHEYKSTLDIKLIEKVHRYYSPVDFR